MNKRLMLVCGEWLKQRPTWRALAPHGGGLSSKMVTKRLLLPRYRNAFPIELHHENEERRLRIWLGEYEAQLLDDLQLVRRATDRAVDEARRLRASVTAGDLADRLVRAVAATRMKREPLSELELDAIASTFVANSPSLDRLLSREEFQQFQDLYDQSWRNEGAAHLAEHPYSRAMLGDDERPPLIRSQRENTWEALGRSVYSRFRMAARDESVPGEADEIARAEVNRACGRLGLAHESALVLLYSLLCGLQLGTQTQPARTPSKPIDVDRTWREAPGPVAADESAEEWNGLPVNGELIALAEATIRAFCRTQAQGKFLLLSGMLETASQHAMRRAWMDCFKHDRQGRYIDADAGAKIVSLAVFKGIPSGEEHRRRERDLRSVNLTRDETPPAPARPSPDVMNRAWAWFSEHPEVVSGIIAGDPEVLAEYRRAAADLGLPDLEYIMSFIQKENS
ncbi:hypothetical protein [Tessaracoccus sp. OH4464_COT-324]|uniref:hypothetical protein n=1 Tax=Tessaracoccus sp. OH4464_COT-324 TaxID=2491059 RepID=UPI000F63FDAC|nr:hypothetical protein [Tessaracoccus sp. OH4464_COT-324]RRD45185.1 hypothetical protein EII42_11685 [Tessaracoccus sp. OH4464_COT-324]